MIVPGEHIWEFNSGVVTLSQEIALAKNHIDKMCTEQTMTGLPLCLFPKNHCQCPICALATLSCPPRGKYFDASLLHHGQLLHIDFCFGIKFLFTVLPVYYPSLMLVLECFGYSVLQINIHH